MPSHCCAPLQIVEMLVRVVMIPILQAMGRSIGITPVYLCLSGLRLVF